MYDGRRAPLQRGWFLPLQLTSVVFCGPHPAGLSADYNLNCLHYSAVAPAYIIINSLSEQPPLCSFQKATETCSLATECQSRFPLSFSKRFWLLQKLFENILEDRDNFFKKYHDFLKNLVISRKK